MNSTRFSNVTLGQRDSAIPGGVGGTNVILKAGATLLTGDVVYLSADNTVNKSTTAGDYRAFAGVVVGGQSYGNTIHDPLLNQTSHVGITAAASGEWVTVQVDGIAYVTAGVGGLAAGNACYPSGATAGRTVTTTHTAQQCLGVCVEAGAAGAQAKMLIQHN
jgi:ribosomal protein L21E